MKQLLLVALLAGLASSALTLLVASSLRSPPPGPAAPATDFKAALGDMERELAALRRDLAARDRPAAFGAAPTVVGVFEAVPGPGTAPASVESAPATPDLPKETIAARFREMAPYTGEGQRDRKATEEHKRRWLLRGESEVLEWFGRPQSIDGSGELEVWHYQIPTGQTNDDTGLPVMDIYWVRINKGRVIDLGD